MATPKIKVYRLDKGYSSASDNDVQSITNDELLPIIDKSLLPEDAYYLSGVTFVEENLVSIGEQVVSVLTNSGGQTQNVGVGDLFDVGGFKPVLRTGGAIIPTENYVIDCALGQVTFNAENYPVSYPLNVEITFYEIGVTTGKKWVTTGFPVYNGLNDTFKIEVYSNSNVFYGYDEFVLTASNGLITFVNDVTSPKVKYYCLTKTAKLFVSEHQNWLLGHLRGNPDVFVGMYDYPGDDSQDQLGNPLIQGAIPKKVDSGFQINYRDGSVLFSESIIQEEADIANNILENKVRANYACYIGLSNVTGQLIEFDREHNGYVFKAKDEKRYVNSHGKRWITKNDYLMPRYFEADGEILPKEMSTNPYDTLELWASAPLTVSETYVISNRERIVFVFNGVIDEITTLTINGVSVVIKNVGDSFVFDFGGTQEFTFTQMFLKESFEYNNLSVDVVLLSKTSGFTFMLSNFVDV